MSNAVQRALVVVRLSRETEATTSPERQIQECQSFCKQRGYEVVGVAKDLGVSGSVDPFNKKGRPSLARWLAADYVDTAIPGEENTDPCPFDIIVFYRLDRLTRSVKNLNRLILWADDNDVLLASATEGHFDLTQSYGRVIVSLVSTVAELELEAIRERNSSAFQHNAKLGKWRGGNPPWGYLPKKVDGEWRLIQDKVQVDTIREVAERVLNGEKLRAIAADLTRRNVQTATNRFREHKGKPQTLNRWHSQRIRLSLESPTMLGQMTVRVPEMDKHGKPKRNSRGLKIWGREEVVCHSDGTPVERAAPILTVSEQKRIKAELAAREVGSKDPDKRKNPTALLVGCVYCAACGLPAYRMAPSGEGRTPRYRCKSVQLYESCSPNTSTPMDYLDNAVSNIILRMVGHTERLERVWEVGSDHSERLEVIDEKLRALVDKIGTPNFKAGTPQAEQLDLRISELVKEQEELQAAPSSPSRWVWNPTGEMFADWWHRQDNENKNAYLRRMGVTVGFIYPMNKGYRQEPRVYLELGELNTMLAQVKGKTAVGEYFKAMNKYGIAGIDGNFGQTMKIHFRDGSVVTVTPDGILKRDDGTVIGRL